jgi:hypothetical protein
LLRLGIEKSRAMAEGAGSKMSVAAAEGAGSKMSVAAVAVEETRSKMSVVAVVRMRSRRRRAGSTWELVLPAGSIRPGAPPSRIHRLTCLYAGTREGGGIGERVERDGEKRESGCGGH